MSEFTKITLAGLDFAALSETEVVDRVRAALDRGEGGRIATPNVDILRQAARDPQVRADLDTADLLVADGTPLVWASRLARQPLPERVTGSGLIWSLSAGLALDGRSVYLLGGEPGPVDERYSGAERAAEVLVDRFPGLRIAGHASPPHGFDRDEETFRAILQRVILAEPDMVFVGLGFPKQERIIGLLRPELPATWFLGCGAAINFVAGDQTRAPLWMQRGGLEWVHRLANEPTRLAGRYLCRDAPYALRLLATAAVAGREPGAREEAEPAVAATPAGAESGAWIDELDERWPIGAPPGKGARDAAGRSGDGSSEWSAEESESWVDAGSGIGGTGVASARAAWSAEEPESWADAGSGIGGEVSALAARAEDERLLSAGEGAEGRPAGTGAGRSADAPAVRVAGPEELRVGSGRSERLADESDEWAEERSGDETGTRAEARSAAGRSVWSRDDSSSGDRPAARVDVTFRAGRSGWSADLGSVPEDEYTDWAKDGTLASSDDRPEVRVDARSGAGRSAWSSGVGPVSGEDDEDGSGAWREDGPSASSDEESRLDVRSRSGGSAWSAGAYSTSGDEDGFEAWTEDGPTAWSGDRPGARVDVTFRAGRSAWSTEPGSVSEGDAGAWAENGPSAWSDDDRGESAESADGPTEALLPDGRKAWSGDGPTGWSEDEPAEMAESADGPTEALLPDRLEAWSGYGPTVWSEDGHQDRTEHGSKARPEHGHRAWAEDESDDDRPEDGPGAWVEGEHEAWAEEESPGTWAEGERPAWAATPSAANPVVSLTPDPLPAWADEDTVILPWVPTAMSGTPATYPEPNSVPDVPLAPIKEAAPARAETARAEPARAGAAAPVEAEQQNQRQSQRDPRVVAARENVEELAARNSALPKFRISMSAGFATNDDFAAAGAFAPASGAGLRKRQAPSSGLALPADAPPPFVPAGPAPRRRAPGERPRPRPRPR
ncbi:hypothetical protein Val02_16730 [Virgisporangium aliadipatigenens]|uniref:WecB/TagA/CpsF family glycosyltransferase n=1 Tax=Virgisporangium aliadipatigenens TaxID=741659 RepID=A0A8J4DPV1_9ACTN|nr:WecB/TagA/CpsF family glycosyltransferase [Virgisporangium aliadipatigenens]GIJ44787.1 hypothetical protein Val02_16730 [Virgisporangium aliadipatigenens]